MRRVFALILILVVTLVVLPQGAVGMLDGPQNTDYLPSLGGEIHVARYDATDQYQPSVAYNWKHQEYFVVWHNNDADGVQRIYGQRIDARTGELLGPQPDAIAGGSLDKYEPDVDYDPVNDRYLVVWTHALSASEYNISGRFVPWEGSTPTLSEFPITQFSCYEFDPRVAYGRADQQFMVVGTHFCGGNPNDIWGQMVPADGSSFNPMQGIIVRASATEDHDNPEIAWNRAQNQFLVLYDVLAGSDWDVYGNLFSGTGTKNPTDILLGITLDHEHHGAVASCAGSDQWLVVWEAMISGDNDLKGVMFEGDLTHIADLTISNYGGHQEMAKASCNYGENSYMVTYQEDISSSIGISARPVNLDGSLGDGLQVQYASSAPGNINPAVAGGHTNYLVVWQNRRESNGNRDIYGKFLTPYSNYLPAMLKAP